MIDRIMLFGCSYMNGDELACADPDIKPRFDAAYGDQHRDHTGSIPEASMEPWMFEAYRHIADTITDFRQRCQDRCMGGYLARTLGVPCENHSLGGYSNDAIMAEVTNQRHRMDARTLVLVGLTHINRTTRLDERSPHGRIRTNNNYSPLWPRNSDQGRYAELSLMFGDDTLTKLIQVRNHIRALSSLLSGIPHLVIDPINIYRQNAEVDGKLFSWPQIRVLESKIVGQHEAILERGVLDHLQAEMDELTFGYTMLHAMVDVRSRALPCREALGHPNRLTHEAFVDGYILPHLAKHGILS